MTTHTRTPTHTLDGSDQGPPRADANTDPAIELGRLTVRYPGADHFALHDVGVSVARGAVLAIVGPSGCGKSTLLKVVAGLLPPSIGTVHLDGVDAASLPVERRRTGWVPQSYALFDHLDVTGNVAFGLRAARVAPAEQRSRIDEVLRLCRITELANRSVVELSGGQRQRVAIARALAPEPNVLLLDEPLGALDPQLRADLRTELATLLRTTGVTTLIVTHDQDEALAIADQVLVLRDGQIEQHGTPVQLWQQPATAFVANFVSGAATCQATIRDGRAVITPGLHLPVDADELTDGTDVEIAVRPQALSLQEPGAPATVIGCEFQAGRWSVTVEPTDVPGLQLRVTATHPVELGDTVSIAASADAAAPIIPATSGPTRHKDAP